MNDDPEVILNESLAFLGGQPVVDDSVVYYGPLTLQIAQKQGKANTLLADHLFSPALYLAERIERGLFPAQTGSTVVELGAGTGLPSLLLATTSDHPALVVATDYPDENILENLKKNLEKNRPNFQPTCRVECVGYEWGTNADLLLKLLQDPSKNQTPRQGYDIVILSDLLHFHGSHDVLISSIQALLSRLENSKVHVSAGKYTHRNVCEDFLRKGREAGLVFEEVLAGPEEAGWNGTMKVGGLDQEALAIRKANCYYWVGRWANSKRGLRMHYKRFMSHGNHNDLDDNDDNDDFFGVRYEDQHSFLDFEDTESGFEDEEELEESSVAQVMVECFGRGVGQDPWQADSES
ncbi:hypothetical protein C0995_000534 [Termitomyces sp. Mi166|nr:hypothetical protein C0995_000534 [Termitomyces sp. Mi166\